MIEVLLAFAKLGVTSFGGPIAHLGYFRAEFVVRRRWLGEGEYADLVALCQFLPGPASSQVGFALGYARAGAFGALAAFAAFTLPSAALLVLVAYGVASLQNPIADGAIAGLMVAAVAIVAQAVLGMAKTLTPDARRAAIAAGTAGLALLLPGWGQPAAIALGAAAGLLLCRTEDPLPPTTLRFAIPRWVGAACLALFVVLLVGLPAAGLSFLDAFYRSGALVFGGGHVVLPLLQTAVVDPGWVDQDTFLAGYAATQAVPGPLFTFAAFLGADLAGVPGAVVALLAIFLPGFLLLVGVLPFWSALRTRRAVRSAMRGANAAVVGILAAALYDPVFTTAVTGVVSFVLALVCFVALVAAKAPPWLVVLAAGVGGAAFAAI